MTIDTNTMISITEANQNVSRVADFSKAEQEKITFTEDVFAISERLVKKNKEAYEVLAK